MDGSRLGLPTLSAEAEIHCPHFLPFAFVRTGNSCNGEGPVGAKLPSYALCHFHCALIRDSSIFLNCLLPYSKDLFLHRISVAGYRAKHVGRGSWKGCKVCGGKASCAAFCQGYGLSPSLQLINQEPQSCTVTLRYPAFPGKSLKLIHGFCPSLSVSS